MTGDVVAGRFVLCDPIGAGGSGTVWRAFDRSRGAFCAAKLLRQRDAGDLLRFVREQSVRLDHPNIVSPYSWVAEDSTVLIASELMTGGSLHTLLGDYGPLAEGTVVTVLGQVLAALAAVHDAELIHRDVKPANVLVRTTGTGPIHVVLTDFGLTISRADARLTQVGTVIGTPGYLPPEVLLGGVPPDPRHDLYAAGRLAVTLLGGDERTGPTGGVIESIQDPVLRQAVDALVRPDPLERPTAARAALALLAGAAADPEPRTREGDPVDVLDQLPALPAGWTTDGPPLPRSPSSTFTAVTAVTVTVTAVVTVTAAVVGPAGPGDGDRRAAHRSADRAVARSGDARSSDGAGPGRFGPPGRAGPASAASDIGAPAPPHRSGAGRGAGAGGRRAGGPAPGRRLRRRRPGHPAGDGAVVRAVIPVDLRGRLGRPADHGRAGRRPVHLAAGG
ncbi:MAG: serine/threonine-protein kinase [Nakamurella multipartita]